jgi:uncharacterized cupredoxin-like copper-binding protein
VFSLLTALILLGGCSQDGDRGGFGEPPPTESPSPSPAEAIEEEPSRLVQVSALGGFRFEPGSLQARAGETAAFELRNEDVEDHTFVVSELAVVMLAGAGQTVRTTAAIDPKNTGRFTFFCSIPGHRAAGMEGVLRVTGS